VETLIIETIKYKSKTAKRLPSRIIRINSFFIRKRSNDSDPRLKANLSPILEKNLMFFSIFAVCMPIEVSKGETNGTGFAT